MIKRFLILILLANFGSAIAQEITLHNMEFVGQRHSLNPALNPTSRIYFGFSGGTHFGNTGFSINDLFKPVPGTDSFILSPRQLTDRLSNNNAIRNDAIGDLSFGFRVNPKLFLHGSIAAKAYSRINYPKELFQFMFEGNASDNNLNKNLDIGNFRFNAMLYRDISMGASYQVNCNLSVGARVKHLYGVANFNTERASLNIRTSSDYYQMTISNDLAFRGSFDTTGDFSTFASEALRGGLKNNGLGMDLGATYKILDDKLLLTGSLIDLGYINWRSHTFSYSNKAENKSFSFDGFDRTFFENDTDFFQVLADTLISTFDLQRDDILSYRTALTPRMYLSGSYEFLPGFKAGALMYGEISNRRLRTAWSFNGQARISRILNAQLNVSLLNKQISNIGAGFAVNLGPLQIWMVSDNLSILYKPFDAKTVHARLGMNFVFGTGKDKRNPCSPHFREASDNSNQNNQQINTESEEPPTPEFNENENKNSESKE
jgi:hypothetical protein